MKKYMTAQKKKIEIDKWQEGTRLKRDPGQRFVLSWIKENGLWFRQQWESSLCRGCVCVEECGFKIKSKCKDFQSAEPWEMVDSI